MEERVVWKFITTVDHMYYCRKKMDESDIFDDTYQKLYQESFDLAYELSRTIITTTAQKLKSTKYTMNSARIFLAFVDVSRETFSKGTKIFKNGLTNSVPYDKIYS